MGKSINIDKAEIVEIHGTGLILTVTKDEEERMLVRVESEEGGGVIRIGQHKEDSKTIVFSLEGPTGPTLKVVK